MPPSSPAQPPSFAPASFFAAGPASRRRFLGPVAASLALLVAGCTAEADPEPAVATPAPPFVTCETLTEPPARSAPSEFFNLELPCFTDDQPVTMQHLRGPAVVNLWASWCRPCREELPLMQELANRTEGKLQVIGVDTGDSRDAAASFATARQITMPTLYDRDRKLSAALGRIALPVTVFIDENGRDYVHTRPVTTPAELTALLREHTGVEVS